MAPFSMPERRVRGALSDPPFSVPETRAWGCLSGPFLYGQQRAQGPGDASYNTREGAPGPPLSLIMTVEQRPGPSRLAISPRDPSTPYAQEFLSLIVIERGSLRSSG